MPSYDYFCHACGTSFVAQQRMSDPVLTTCSCGAEGKVERLLSAGAGLIFKGAGFYKTDYKASSDACAKEGASCEPAPAAAAHSCTSPNCCKAGLN